MLNSVGQYDKFHFRFSNLTGNATPEWFQKFHHHVIISFFFFYLMDIKTLCFMNVQSFCQVLHVKWLCNKPQAFWGQQLRSSARLTVISPVRVQTGWGMLLQLYSTGTMLSFSHLNMQQPSSEAFQTSPTARGVPKLSVHAANTYHNSNKGITRTKSL